ncbi:melanoma-associated antigen 9-like [Sorex fumeus]|uniref:melanoma-associated antigen 9-like n=1 Tax=Sorex fumeus TaxID=62283 RepID=UPI0024AE0A04|nr:melanoma-associated antigen 9-like [Sorex fumeus]
MNNTPLSQLEENASGQVVPYMWEEPEQLNPFFQEEFYEKTADMVVFLLLKCHSKQLTTKAEMVNIALNNDQAFFPMVFSKACECMQLVFGIVIIKVEPRIPAYALATNLGLSHDGIVGPDYRLPKTGLLITVLGIIVREGNCVSEDEIWRALSMMGVCVGIEHFIYGEPGDLLTNVWVQEQYLEYCQVPGSDPPHYVFLWGLRAHAETNEGYVMEFWLRATNRF